MFLTIVNVYMTDLSYYYELSKVKIWIPNYN